MNLLETATETVTIETIITAAIGLLTTCLAYWRGRKAGAKGGESKAPNAKVAGMLAIAILGAMATSGCASAIQKEAIKNSVAQIRPIVKDLEDRAGATESERLANEKHLTTLEQAAE
jgi:hypothetical protein